MKDRTTTSGAEYANSGVPYVEWDCRRETAEAESGPIFYEKARDGNCQMTDIARRRSEYLALIPLVLNSVDADNTRRVYQRQLDEFFDWYKHNKPGPFSKASVQAYVRHLRQQHKTASTCNQALTVIRKLAEEACDNGLLDATLAQGIAKIKGVKRRGQKTGNWLSQDQAKQLITAPNVQTLKGKRDRVLIGLLLECGLRREEAAEITVEQLQEREGRMVIVDLVGKGGRLRTVPVHWRTAAKIEDWVQAAGITEGRLLRPVNKADRLDSHADQMSTTAIYKQVREYAEQLGLQAKPHDLRRTFGKLVREGGAAIEQIRETYGHSSVRTTERYLGIHQDLREGQAPCDKIDLEGGSPTKRGDPKK